MKQALRLSGLAFLLAALVIETAACAVRFPPQGYRHR